MSDGRLIFDTKIDSKGFDDGLRKLQSSGTAFEQTGGKLTKYITKPALAATTALAGMALVKGFNRLKNIDTARAQLEGLGHSATEVEAIMDSAMQSVKGTAYGFDEAATAAASAVAAGIEPGKELTRYLGLVGDAAAQSKLSFTEMGSIFNKVMAGGRISMEEVNQLADQGIPIYKMLSEQLGVTTADVRKLVENGKVDSETFLAAIESNIGGAAKIMGEKSFVGALSNIGASLGRIGANFLDAGGKGGGFFSQLKPLMVEAMDVMSGLEDKAADWGVAFGNAFTKFVNIVKGIPAPILGIGTALAVSIGPMTKFAGKIIKLVAKARAAINVMNASRVAVLNYQLATAGASLKAGVANGVLTKQQAVVGNLANKISSLSLATIKDTAAKGLNAIATSKVFKSMKAAGSEVLTFTKRQSSSAIVTMRDTAVKLINAVATSKVGMAAKTAGKAVLGFAKKNAIAMGIGFGLVGAIAALAIYMSKTGASADDVAAKITGFADNLAGMITQFANELPGMIDSIMPAITKVVESLVVALPALIPVLINAGIQLFMSLVNSLSQIIPPLIAALIQSINALVAILPTLIPLLINAGITLFMALVNAIPKILPPLIAALPRIVQAFANAVPVLIPALLQAAITLFMAIVQAIPQIVIALIKAMPKIIKAIATGLISGVGKIFSVGVTLLKKLWSGISSWAGNLKSRVVSLAKSLPGKIKSGLGSLMSIGKNWIEGLWNGIKSAKDWLIGKIQRLCKSAKNAIKDFFGINSPSRLMAYLGKSIPIGLGVGIESKTKALVGTVKDQMQALKEAYSYDIGNVSVTRDLGARFAGTRAQSVAGAEAQGAPVYNQTVNFYRTEESPIETARAIRNQNMFGLAGGRA